MGKKRRKDKSFKIGESTPGTTGDSGEKSHDQSDSPMAEIHNRRDGELLSKEEIDEFLNPREPSEIHPHHEPKERTSEPYEGRNLTDEEIDKLKVAKKYRNRYSHYWSDDEELEDEE